MTDSPLLPKKRPLFEPPPLQEDAKRAQNDLGELLRPCRKSGLGYLPFLGGDILQRCMEQIAMYLHFFLDGDKTGKSFGWISALLHTAHAWRQGLHCAQKLREWTRNFLEDCHQLPFTPEASLSVSLLEKPDLKEALCEHLQSIGKYVQALDIVEFMANPETLTRYGLQKPIGLSTAQTWMHILDYHWTKVPSGQYIDGHKCEDIVAYCDNVFLPTMARLEQHARGFIDGAMVQGPVLPNGAFSHEVTVILDDTSELYHGIEIKCTMADGSVHRGVEVEIPVDAVGAGDSLKT
ncbi:hypothetical protein EVJ58_g711 [Rhodofomes roseus]|uniref:Uncharacterized protein n=1 Tax=Rhodofomes roseus TaxID=34475 RepID=A0A4Y9Z315_9APHY|nr:hypothetical protein EVJ58_g711 [Rhodofomes roseus]